MTTISTALKENQHRSFKMLAIALSLIIYCAGLIYAGVRSYTLFAGTIDPSLLPLAVIGIVTLEISGVALPLAIHFWTQPGVQRLAAYGFYIVDLTLIATNSVLDAAHHSNTSIADFLSAYNVYMLPVLPLICMAGWSLIWLLDPSSRERDMRESVKAATNEALLAQIQRAVEQADITQAVEDAAHEAAYDLVGETLGNASRRSKSLASYNAETKSTPTKVTRNTRKSNSVADPK